MQLFLSQTRPVAFAVRTNVAYDGVVDDDDAYVQGHTVSFKAKDFLHIKAVCSSLGRRKT